MGEVSLRLPLPQRSSTLARRVAHFQHFDAPLLTVSDQQFQYRHPERPFTPIRRPDYFDEQNTSSDKGLFARVLLLDLRRFCLTVLPRLPKLMSTFTKQGRQRRGSRYHDIAGGWQDNQLCLWVPSELSSLERVERGVCITQTRWRGLAV